MITTRDTFAGNLYLLGDHAFSAVVAEEIPSVGLKKGQIVTVRGIDSGKASYAIGAPSLTKDLVVPKRALMIAKDHKSAEMRAIQYVEKRFLTS